MVVFRLKTRLRETPEYLHWTTERKMPKPIRVHLVTGGFPPGSFTGHDMDYARLRLLGLLQENSQVLTTSGNDFADVAKWLPDSRFLITYVAGGHLYRAGPLPFAISNVQPFVDSSVEPLGKTPQVFRGSWETAEFEMLLCNAREPARGHRAPPRGAGRFAAYAVWRHYLSENELSQTPEPRNEPADFTGPDAKFRTIGSLEVFLLVDSLAADAQRHPDQDDGR